MQAIQLVPVERKRTQEIFVNTTRSDGGAAHMMTHCSRFLAACSSVWAASGVCLMVPVSGSMPSRPALRPKDESRLRRVGAEPVPFEDDTSLVLLPPLREEAKDARRTADTADAKVPCRLGPVAVWPCTLVLPAAPAAAAAAEAEAGAGAGALTPHSGTTAAAAGGCCCACACASGWVCAKASAASAGESGPGGEA